MPTQPAQLWENPLYAWQQQLASGANLAKNLNPMTLLGLTLGTGLGSWLGNRVGNWQQESDFLQRMTNSLIDKGYSDVTYDKGTRQFTGVDANGNKFYFGRDGKIIPQQTPATNPAFLQRQQTFDIGYTPSQNPYLFGTPQQYLNERLKPNPQNWAGQQNLRKQPPYFPLNPSTNSQSTPSQNLLPLTPWSEDDWSKSPEVSKPFARR